MPDTTANADVNQSPTGTSASTNTFNQEIQNRLLAQADVVSSSDTGIEKAITSAIQGTQKAGQATAGRINLEAGRQRGYLEQQGQTAVQGFTEGRSGFATQMTALRNLVQTTDKNLNDLESRRQEALLQNDANTASQIAGLQIQELQFKQQAQQQTFSNLLGLSQLGQSQQQIEQQQYQFNVRQKFDEQTAMSSVALQYGLDVQPGESFKDLYSRAVRDMGADSPAALAIKEAKSTIDANNANIRRINAEIAQGNQKLSATDEEALAQAISANPNNTDAILNGITDINTRVRILNKSGEIEHSTAAQNAVNDGKLLEDYVADILRDKSLSETEKASYINAANKVYSKPENRAKLQTPSTGFSTPISSAVQRFGAQSFQQFPNISQNIIGSPDIAQIFRAFTQGTNR